MNIFFFVRILLIIHETLDPRTVISVILTPALIWLITSWVRRVGHAFIGISAILNGTNDEPTTKLNFIERI